MARMKFTQKIADEICKRIADGQSLYTICADSHMPARGTVLNWLTQKDKYIGFDDQYARARRKQADAYAEQIVDIADNEKDPQKAKVRIDARKWVAGKLRPKKYSDRMKLEHMGEDGGPVKASLTVNFVKVEDNKE